MYACAHRGRAWEGDYSLIINRFMAVFVTCLFTYLLEESPFHTLAAHLVTILCMFTNDLRMPCINYCMCELS